MSGENIDLAKKIFQSIADSFPNLKMKLEIEPKNVGVEMRISSQEGLKFDVNVNLQGDELHLNIGDNFWAEWFPCADQKIVDEYIEAVRGILSGELRVLETYQGKKVVKAELQFPNGDQWGTKVRWSTWALPFLGKKTAKILVNK